MFSTVFSTFNTTTKSICFNSSKKIYKLPNVKMIESFHYGASPRRNSARTIQPDAREQLLKNYGEKRLLTVHSQMNLCWKQHAN